MEDAFFGQSLADWIAVIHRGLQKKYHSPQFSIQDKDYGYEAIRCISVNVLAIISPEDIQKAMRKKLKMDRYIEAAHNGWCSNYIYWKSQDYNINSEECNDRATSTVSHLCKDDIKLYRTIVNIIFDALVNHLVDSGLAAMSLT